MKDQVEANGKFESIMNKLIDSEDLRIIQLLNNVELEPEENATLISLAVKLLPQLLKISDSLENVLRLADDFDNEGLVEEANRIRQQVLTIDDYAFREESESLSKDVLSLSRATSGDLVFLQNSGTGMPSVDVVRELSKNLFNNVPVWTIRNPDETVIGAVSLVNLFNGDWTTVTFVRSDFHTPVLSRAIKEAARKAVLEFGGKYIVLVNPDNYKAIESMSKVWADADVRQFDDGTLAYSYSGNVEDGSWSFSSYVEFSNYLNQI